VQVGSVWCKLMHFGKRNHLPFLRKSDRQKKKRSVSFTHEQNIICSQTKFGARWCSLVQIGALWPKVVRLGAS